MQHAIRISTSDHVELEFELAGPVSRFGAFLIDTLIIYAAVGLLLVFGLVLFHAANFRNLGAWVLALAILLVFLLSTGYFVVCEGLTRGNTPGKRLFGLRVLHDDGVPLGWKGAAIRNLVRVVDLLPPPTGLVGLISVLANRNGQRLGDMAAGTIVVRERFAAQVETDSGALWMERVEKGSSRQAITLPGGQVSVAQITLIERFLRRRWRLPLKQRRTVAWNLAKPILPLLGEDPDLWERQVVDRGLSAEDLLERVLGMAQPGSAQAPELESGTVWLSSGKRMHWKVFRERAELLLKGGKRALARLSPGDLSGLIADYRRVAADLARARSLGADSHTIDHVNRLAIQGHNVLYGYSSPTRGSGSIWGWPGSFARVVRRRRWAMFVSALLLFGPTLLSSFAILWNPRVGYDIVHESFLDFSPASEENLHDIPPLTRPVAASSILANNIQVSLAAFALGLTAGVGTTLLLIFNGVHIGGVIGWLTFAGHQRALWGWIMPHGGTELLAITVAGGAGFVLAEAILAPGQLSRRAALKRSASDALVLELGCMAMLALAGMIEGFVSPSQISYPARIGILVASLVFWLAYFAFAGRRRKSDGSQEPSGQQVA